MATAKGTMRIAEGNRIRAISIYLDDTTNDAVTFDESKIAVAGSPQEYVVKSNSTIVDICLTSDVATPTHLQVLYNGVPTGDILDCTAQLASVVARPNPMIPLSSGAKIKIIQVA